ncbi:MAG: hypothetical protein DMG64_05870 [Acidobacteria bacterium]|nr:MAG: hypothetical protein DMG63_08285 [Acidobacteriota bacterium]PYY03986.1 MAG: hypothetical protein DMG64_05870 [Acidobacteriota bacterium]PYY21839.1 MAG: hypothetical protein DMG62_16945 [Acidobacteriota bacterium]
MSDPEYQHHSFHRGRGVLLGRLNVSAFFSKFWFGGHRVTSRKFLLFVGFSSLDDRAKRGGWIGYPPEES